MNFSRIVTHPNIKIALLGAAARRLGWPKYETRVDCYLEDRPHYAYGTLNAARLAKQLGLRAVSVIEFGVAGGNGLLNLQHHAKKASAATGIKIEVYGFDTGEGLPEPQGFRDLPHHWQRGFFAMNQEALKPKLHTAKLVLGNIKDVRKEFAETYKPAPVGFIAHDMDFYSSTKECLEIFSIDASMRLPRIINYFDDTIGTETEMYSKSVGQLAAIEEYNANHEKQKIAECRNFLKDAPLPWHYAMYIHHDFEHPLYNQFIGEAQQQLPLK